MMQYGLTLEIVSDRARCSMVEAYEALHLQYFRVCKLIIIAKVRRGIEDELHERGWNGRRDQLWTEFDATLERHLRGNCKAPQHRPRTKNAIKR